MRRRTHSRNGERGVTMLLVVAAMFAILAMAALAIDVMTLYAAHTDAQRASDAAALAGARMYVLSGFTSWQMGDPSLGATQGPICGSGSPGSGVANSEAVAAAAQNQIAGQNAAVTSINCDFTSAENPRLTVTTGRTDLPTFFGRVFGRRTVSVSATATAEVFNASGSTVPISLASVKPWLIPNCDPNNVPCAGGDFFVDTANSYVLHNPGAYIGREYFLRMRRTASPAPSNRYYALDMSGMQANVCPSTTATGCLNAGGGGYLDNVACANPNRMSCGASVTLSNQNLTPQLPNDNLSGAQCLIHTDDVGASADQDSFSGTPPSPILVSGGLANPNPSLQGVSNISRSDSIVTVPLFEWNGVDPCPSGTCGGPQTVIGFLQLGVEDVGMFAGTAVPSAVHVIVLNAVGCNPSNSGTPVTGGGVSAVPVRLVQ